MITERHTSPAGANGSSEYIHIDSYDVETVAVFQSVDINELISVALNAQVQWGTEFDNANSLND